MRQSTLSLCRRPSITTIPLNLLITTHPAILIEIYNEFELGYESSMQVRLGAEYMLATQLGTIPLRGGVDSHSYLIVMSQMFSVIRICTVQ